MPTYDSTRFSPPAPFALVTLRYELADFEDRASLARAVRAEMVFLGLTFRGQFLLVEQDYGLIGRNVLNTTSLIFDGPRLSWEKSS